jgi:GTPase-activator protein for Ras-like GTPase.
MDLIFTCFICPAIVNPEPYGITEASISYIARSNLIEVAKLLQMLALKRYQEIDPKLEDICSQFEKVRFSC